MKPHRVDGDGRVHVSLAELIAQRARVVKAAVPAIESHAARYGQQSSRLYGRGMDYAESRAYQPGDDVRRLDWRLTARSGKLHTKLFQEEREGRLLILLDTHASMHFGTRVRFKSVQAARAAATAAWYAVRAGERVGVMAFGQQGQGNRERLLRPQAGARGALAVCGALAEWDAAPVQGRDEPLSEALTRARRVLHGASRVLLISDGLSCDEPAAKGDVKGRLLDLSRHARISVLIVADALELAWAPAGSYPLEHDGERREVVLQAERQRSEFQRSLGAGQARLNSLAQGLGLSCRSIDTAADPLDAVTALLGPNRTAR
ncbi:DUF58 domain-containing protein [Dyella tabacisoli]|uniref:DUF58 domain-containing protein n=1 Tax=Dyella tabacisoli TaxID=2282381 RepID=A0A369UNP7_9GAMM|nr:DUF58 domain-containing protein [Dyella tabacisoli]RDD81943.1 DUF58 domain-containing protein [Dyella tabacisoli]